MRHGGAVRVLCVAEKPSVCRGVTEILVGGRLPPSRPGFSNYNPVYDFQCQLRGRNCDVRFTSVSGHLMGIDFPDRFRKWTSCSPEQLFEAPVQKIVNQENNQVNLKRTLQREATTSDWLILWLDCDREGENIAFEVIEVCREVNPRLDIWRARFSAVIPREINQAINNLVRPNENEAMAVDARQEIDLRLGAAFTRFQTLLLQNRFDFEWHEDKGPLLSYGPCQFPTLGFIVERAWAIAAHVAEDFWTIKCCYVEGRQGDPGGREGDQPGLQPGRGRPAPNQAKADFNWRRGRMFDHMAATILYEMCIDAPIATVTKASGRESLKHPPVPLNTLEMQKRGSRYLRLGAEQTLQLAEELYQAGFLSYPRTETDAFPEGTDVMGMVEAQQHHERWGAYVLRMMNDGLYRPPGSGGHNDEAHPPIHPTKCASVQEMGTWPPPKQQVYELVVRHFLACCSIPAVGQSTDVEIDIAGELFSTRGLIVKQRNWLEVYRYESWGGNANLPFFEEGMTFVPSSMFLEQGRTQPPNYLGEAELLSMMDQNGIGTDATMAQHIETMTKRNYATKTEANLFKPTKLGEALLSAYVEMGMVNMWKPVLRAAMEQ
ncbi:DNA topoisomerase 3-alpha, partial [Cymbomonas tetramitiformis]